MIRGSCLCGTIQFEIDRVVAPFELCHCRRCRKVSGSAFMAGVSVEQAHFRWVSGQDSVRSYEAPLLYEPPAYRITFCSQCGSPVPDPENDEAWFQVAAGLLEGELQVGPDKHIYVEHQAAWHNITDRLPRFDKEQLRRHREREGHIEK